MTSIAVALGFHAIALQDLLDRTHGHSFFDNQETVYTSPSLPTELLAHVNVCVARYSIAPDARAYLERYYQSSIHGGFYIEVEDLDRWYSRVREAGAPIRKELGDTSYGHRNFKTVDPSGVEVCFFEHLGSGKSDGQ